MSASMESDLIGTINEEDEVKVASESSDSDDEVCTTNYEHCWQYPGNVPPPTLSLIWFVLNL